MEPPPLLSKLWLTAERLGRERATDPRFVLDPCGLLLEWPPRRWDYFCTPLNSLTFASTGGDGVHYGLLTVPGRSADATPVVMTVPMAGTYNVVIAETLEEFLGLGYFVGWFALEQLTYQPAWAVRFFGRPRSDWPEREALLVHLRAALDIHHVPLRQRRIRHLQSTYLHLLRLPPEPQDPSIPNGGA